MEEAVCPEPRACPVLSTASTMQILTEALDGFTGFGHYTGRIGRKVEDSQESGRRIVDLVKQGKALGYNEDGSF